MAISVASLATKGVADTKPMVNNTALKAKPDKGRVEFIKL
jgi:hypothetical protein